MLNTFARFRARGGAILGTITYPDVDALRLFDIRWVGATAQMAINRAIIGSVATDPQANWQMRFVGGGQVDRLAHGLSARSDASSRPKLPAVTAWPRLSLRC